MSKLKEALAVYKQCNKLVNQTTYKNAVDRCQQRIDDRLKFKHLFDCGEKEAVANYFKNALNKFEQAKKLFATEELLSAIDRCILGIEREEKYERALIKANEIARQGDFNRAINSIIPAVKDFSRQDGEDLLNKLRKVIRGKDLYKLGLNAERAGNLEDAIATYKKVLELIPEYLDCKLRLAIVTLKNNPQQAIDYLQKSNSERAIYIRGFAYTKLNKWQQADTEWSAIDSFEVNNQRQIIRDSIERDRLIKIEEIEQLVEQKELATAASACINFLQEYPADVTVKHNLENHLKPFLASQVWQSENWSDIATKTKKAWLEKQDIVSLHNWAIATYYQAQFNSDKIAEFITAWMTALANLKLNTSLKDIPWLASNPIGDRDIAEKLKQIIENIINTVKDSDLEKYLELRDIYRRDLVLLSLSQQQECGIKINNRLLILPNCYHYCPELTLQKIDLPARIWGALYTDWGRAVAACQEGDVARGIKLEPKQNPVSKSDHFASNFVAYHRGCHYLENLYWRKAMESLDWAKSEIAIESNWCDEIDRLCAIQRQHIDNFDEHLKFSESWYLLVGSQTSKTYYIDHKAMQIGLDIDDKKIDFKTGLKKLKALKDIDPDNEVLSNIMTTLEVNLELQKINRLWQRSEYEEAVRIAKRSRHEKVRLAVAEVCLEIVLEILRSGNLTNDSFSSLQKITQWAYELCPHEPSFQPVYSQLRQIGIH
ncbi:MAG: hypothetical protein AAGE96_09690 [Cyanobacteria bacterium P01_G01_bin.19]